MVLSPFQGCFVCTCTFKRSRHHSEQLQTQVLCCCEKTKNKNEALKTQTSSSCFRVVLCYSSHRKWCGGWARITRTETLKPLLVMCPLEWLDYQRFHVEEITFPKSSDVTTASSQDAPINPIRQGDVYVYI